MQSKHTLGLVVLLAGSLVACSHAWKLKRHHSGCGAGVIADCLGVARGEEIVREPGWEERGFTALNRACEAGDRIGCWKAAEFLDVSTSKHRDPARVAELYEEGCDPAQAGSCERATVLLATLERQRTEVLAKKSEKDEKGGLDKAVIAEEIHSSEVSSRTGLTASIGACVLHVTRTMQFPPPRGGGVVAVTFPWVFKSSR